ncbi:MAG TPA: 1-deoxy-D-xylulose-5-phosphate synthase, partial [Treponema sp.]|nr:1-deoxy-D-xylulose-5-phosphate synthase [Treponema sp.]
GIFGLAAFTNIPELVVLCPTSAEEYRNMLDWSLCQKEHPVLILIPGNAVSHRPADTDYGALNTFKVEQQGQQVAIIALGDFFQKGEELAAAIKKELGFTPTLINPRYASGIDATLLRSLEAEHRLVITLEDGILEGGFGQKIASFYGAGSMRVKNYGLEKKFYDRYDPQELLRACGMTTAQMLADAKALL